ncbi:hypothetical protein D3C73_1042920 [compost metagenome]
MSELQAQHAVQRTDVGVARLDSRLIAPVLEHRAGFAVFHFLVLVVRVGEVELDALERPVKVAQLARHAEAFLVHLDAYILFGNRPIVGVVTAIGQACVTVIACP